MSGREGLTREGAREAAREELSRRQYADAEPPLLARAVSWVLRELSELLDRASGAPGGVGGLVLLTLLVAGLVAVVLTRTGPVQRRRRAAALFAGATVLTADGHRQAAEQAAAQGQWAQAVRERLRAVVRELEARGVLDPRPGRTAGEVASDAGAAVPELAGDLQRGTALFDEVWYGGRPADAGSYATLVSLDERVSATRLTAA